MKKETKVSNIRPLIERLTERFPTKEGFKVTQSLIDDIQTELKSVRANPVRIATKFGVPASMIRFIMQETPSPTTKYVQHSDDGWGRYELRDYVVTRCVAGDGWGGNSVKAIAKARTDYDAGTHEMCQGRDGDFLILYSIPRKAVDKERVKRGKYFIDMDTQAA